MIIEKKNNSKNSLFVLLVMINHARKDKIEDGFKIHGKEVYFLYSSYKLYSLIQIFSMI